MSAAKRVAHAAETIRARWEHNVESDPQTEAAQALEDTCQLLDPEVAEELKRLRVRLDEVHRIPQDTLTRAEVRLGQYAQPPRVFESSTEQALFQIACALRDTLEETRDQRNAARVKVLGLEAERHSTNEALDDAVQALREKEKREAIVAEFVAARAEVITAIRNCHPDNGHDYDRWQGHAESRRQLAESLGLPVAWPPEGAK